MLSGADAGADSKSCDLSEPIRFAKVVSTPASAPENPLLHLLPNLIGSEADAGADALGSGCGSGCSWEWMLSGADALEDS